MKFFVAFSLLLASVSAGPFDSVDFRTVKPRLRPTRVPLVPPSESVIQSRITNGEAATAKQFPSQAGLLLENIIGSFSWCGGTVIGERWILTAAHCLVDTLGIRVILGTVRSEPVGAAGEIIVDVEVTNKTVIVHEDYDDWELTNDVGLIRLPEPLTFTDYVKPASLPSFTGRAPRYSGETAIASGWGITNDGGGNIAALLQWTDNQVITNAKCATIYGRLETSHLCLSTADRKSTCSGDSGGPLFLKDTDTIVGVTSFVSYLGCESGYPAGFSRVSSFLEWIHKNSGIMP